MMHGKRNIQRGAMFGMDARVALLIMAILAGVGGWNMISRLESQKMDLAEANASALREGLRKYYETVGINRLPETLDELFRSGVMTDNSLRRDPWGNPWEYFHTNADVKLEGTPITLQFAVVFSRGKNAVDDTGSFGSAEGFATWAPLKDDVGVKYTSRDTEVQRLQDYRARALQIVEKIEAYEAAAFLEAQSTCSGETVPDWCTDMNGKNWTMFNYYPRTTADETTGVVYYSTEVLNKRVYESGNPDDMKQLLMDLGLPANLVNDPWGKMLLLNTNITGRESPPYSASICFSAGENCLEARTE